MLCFLNAGHAFILLYVTLYGELVFLPPQAHYPMIWKKSLGQAGQVGFGKQYFVQPEKKTIDFHRTIQCNGFHYIYHE